METSAFADNGASSTQASTNTSFEDTKTIATLRVEIGLGHNNLIYLFIYKIIYLSLYTNDYFYNHLYVFIYNYVL